MPQSNLLLQVAMLPGVVEVLQNPPKLTRSEMIEA